MVDPTRNGQKLEYILVSDHLVHTPMQTAKAEKKNAHGAAGKGGGHFVGATLAVSSERETLQVA